ncbi:hypothetical protein FACS1894155_06430 [Bacteroidia bacterium]|nr:hypothetical protein FACS189455_0450 [Bacteroidia bacterium]GHU89443.1 hypothetical protein FACS1894155_06430 [Bacteroidia bacterium]
MFVNAHSVRRILVYDLDGKFKRSFKHKEGTMYSSIYNFGRENLICHDSFYTIDGIANELSFRIISKQDGSIIKEIQIPLIPNLDHWILVEPSSDTVYRYLPDYTMTPLITRIVKKINYYRMKNKLIVSALLL